LERYLREQGFQTFAFQGAWEDLREQLEKGRPLIVALGTGRDDLHYVVVTGLDWRQNVVLKNDPAERKLLKQSRASFEKEWTAAANWMLLAVPQQDGPASSRSSF
jgi:ABC-type bacteriocin/lantibiotic exporter with double-glycine peptidase domain